MHRVVIVVIGDQPTGMLRIWRRERIAMDIEQDTIESVGVAEVHRKIWFTTWFGAEMADAMEDIDIEAILQHFTFMETVVVIQVKMKTTVVQKRDKVVENGIGEPLNAPVDGALTRAGQ